MQGERAIQNTNAKAVCCSLTWISAVALAYKSADTGRQPGTDICALYSKDILPWNGG
jgi:hypothetical protein